MLNDNEKERIQNFIENEPLFEAVRKSLYLSIDNFRKLDNTDELTDTQLGQLTRARTDAAAIILTGFNDLLNTKQVEQGEQKANPAR